jgi:hypothetical protein
MEYALIDLSTNKIIETRYFDAEPVDVSHKGIKWLPIVINRPACNLDFQIEEPPLTTIKDDCVEIAYVVRSLTEDELKQKKYEQINAELFGPNISAGLALLMVYNQLQESLQGNKISQSKFISLIVNAQYFSPDTEENLVQNDKFGNPLE